MIDESKLLYSANGMLKTDICHHGLKGQRHGYRRYQHPDGTWTALGLKRRRKANRKPLSVRAKRAINKCKNQLLSSKKDVAKFIAKAGIKTAVKQVMLRAGKALITVAV